MSKFSRRKLITAGVAATAGASGLAVATRLAQRHGLIPPDGGGIYGPGETLTYDAQRILTRHSFAREFAPSQISKPPFANEVAPLGEGFKRLQEAGFADWRLIVDGMVARPASFSIAQLKRFPGAARSLIWRAKRAGPTLPNGLACLYLTSSRLWGFCPKPAMLSTVPFNPTGGKASTWPMHCTRKRRHLRHEWR
jgi:hypothetical protein